MKTSKFFIYVLIFIILAQGCSTSDSVYEPFELDEMKFPVDVSNYGKDVAKQLRKAVKDYDKMGIDYKSLENEELFKTKFNAYFNRLSRRPVGDTSIVNSMDIYSGNSLKELRKITEIQARFITRIIRESHESSSYSGLLKRLVHINSEIYLSVPKNQQDRLLRITATLYYCLSELIDLEKEGILLSTSSGASGGRLMSGGETGGGECTKFLATVWTIAIAEPTPVGEVVASIMTIYIAGQLFYEVVTCKPLSRDQCIEKYVSCAHSLHIPDWQCNDCLTYCRGQGIWDCPRPL